jgi:hypothetical protein
MRGSENTSRGKPPSIHALRRADRSAATEARDAPEACRKVAKMMSIEGEGGKLAPCEVQNER